MQEPRFLPAQLAHQLARKQLPIAQVSSQAVPFQRRAGFAVQLLPVHTNTGRLRQTVPLQKRSWPPAGGGG